MPNDDKRVPDELLDELGSTTMQVGRLMSARHGDMCPHESMSPAHLFALQMLSEREPAKISDMAALAGVKAPAASAMVDALEKAGLVSREHSPDDRRVSLLRLTQTGREALEHAEEMRRQTLRRYTAVLSEEDLNTLVRINRTLIAAMTDGTL